FGEDHLYFPECHSQSEWEFQSILSKTSSLNLLEAINPLHFMSEEPFLTDSEHQDYISPSLLPSSLALTNTLEISTSRRIEEENHVQKDPGKNSKPMIKPNPISQQDSSCDTIHLPTSKINESDLQCFKPPGRSLSSLKPLWNFLSGCLVLLLSLSGTVCSLVVERAGLQDISVGSGLGGNQKGGLGNFFDSPVWGEPLGFAQLSDLKVKKKSLESPHRREIGWCWYLFDTLGWLGWTRMRIRTRDKQNTRHWIATYTDRMRSWGETFSRALPVEGKIDKGILDHRQRTCCHEAVSKIFDDTIYRQGFLHVFVIIFLPISKKPQAACSSGSTFNTMVTNYRRSAVSQSSPSIVVRRHESHRQPSFLSCLHLTPNTNLLLRFLRRLNQSKEPQTYNFYARISFSAPVVKSGRSEQRSLWTSCWKVDRKRVIDDDHKRQQRTPTKLINPIAATSSVPARLPESNDINHDTCNDVIKALDLHANQRSIDRHHSCYRLHRSVQPWILQTSKKKQHQIQVDETGHILKDPFPFDSCSLKTSKRKQDRHQVNVNETDHTEDFPNFDFYHLNAYKEINRLPADACNQFFNTAFDVR
ncbi:hypothetical protein MJO28_003118, partial [Puccinia striiformis f. sp. tritici]